MVDVVLQIQDQQIVAQLPAAAEVLAPIVAAAAASAANADASADAAAASAAASLASSVAADLAADAAYASAHFYATRAEGVAAVPVGGYFVSAETGTLRMYARTGGAPFYVDQGDAAAPVGRAYVDDLRQDLAAAGGAAMVEHNGSTVEQALDNLEALAFSPSELDNKPLRYLLVDRGRAFPETLRELHRRPDRAAIDAIYPIAVGERRNVWGQTENIASTYYSANNSAKQAETIVVDGITLTRLSGANFYSALSSNVSGNGLTPFVVGHRYLVSCYVLEVAAASGLANANDDEKFCWMRSLANGGSQAHGPKFVSNRMRRIWTLAQATTTSNLDNGAVATAALGTGGNDNVWWYFSGQGDATNRDIYIGGFQIEDLNDAAYKDGIACIGDSIMQGAAGAIDAYNAREWVAYLAAHLNVCTFNRGVGGERLDNMDARWATDITPLAVRCSDVIIAGGANDIGQGTRTLGQMQASVNSMVAKAIADGLRPILCTVTPTTSIAANPAYETLRQDFNTWLKRTFANVIDLAAVVEDPFIGSKLRNDPDWVGDGIHPSKMAKRAMGAFAASWPHWNKREPGPYQANPNNQNAAWTGPASVLRGAAGQLVGQRKTGWALPTGNVSRATFDPATVTLVQLAERFAALVKDLEATAGHGLIGA